MTATSATHAWAVGYTGRRTLILRWNGTNWKRVPSPDPPGRYNDVAAVAAVRGHAWAAGYNAIRSFILQWNGTTWKCRPATSKLLGPLVWTCGFDPGPVLQLLRQVLSAILSAIL